MYSFSYAFYRRLGRLVECILYKLTIKKNCNRFRVMDIVPFGIVSTHKLNCLPTLGHDLGLYLNLYKLTLCSETFFEHKENHIIE